MTASLPTVSVVIPVYNTGLWTCDAIDSVLAQTHPAHEILLVDDGSEAPSADLLDRAALAHPGLMRVLRHPVNRGLAAARNTGIRAASGDLLVFLDSDDVLADPGVLADIAQRHARTNFDMARLRLRFWKQDPTSGAERQWDDGSDAFIPVNLSGVTAVQAPAMFQSRAFWQFVYRRRFLVDEGIFFDDELIRREDRPFLNHALLKARRIDMTARLGFLYRQRPDSIMHRPKVEDLALFACGAEIARGRIRDAGQALGPARFILDLHYLTALHGLLAPFLKAGEEDAARDMLTRFRGALIADMPPGHPSGGLDAEAAFAHWPEAAEQTSFPPSVARELGCGWLAHLHARLIEGVEPVLTSIWAATGGASRAGLASRAIPVARAAEDARDAALGEAMEEVAVRAPAARPARRPKLLLHVGLTKTGSTYLQNFCELNRARLRDRGVIYPATGIYREPETDRGSGHNLAMREVFMGGRRPTLTAMLDEITDSGATSAIVSCENLSWNADWRNPAGLRALSRALAGFDVSVLMVVRDEYDWLVSMYKEAVAGGWLRFSESPAAFFGLHSALGSVDFKGILDGFAAEFGADRCHMLDLAGDGDLARRALAILDPALAEDPGFLTAPRANVGTPDAATASLRLLNTLPAQGAVDRAYLANVRDLAPPADDAGPRIDAMLDGLAALRATAGRAPWNDADRARNASRLATLWGSVDLRHGAGLVTDRARWARPAPGAQAAEPKQAVIQAAPAIPQPLTPLERMFDHAAGEGDRRLRRFGAPRPYGFSVRADADAGTLTLASDVPLGALRLIWGTLEHPEAEEGEWTSLPDDACAAMIPVARRRFAAHALLTIVARQGKRVWRREVLFALDHGAPVAIVLGGEAAGVPEHRATGPREDPALDLVLTDPVRPRLADLPLRAAEGGRR